MIQLPLARNHFWLSVPSSWINIKTKSGRYFNKRVILKCDLWVACLWNATPVIRELQTVSLEIIGFCVAIQSVC